MKKIVLLFFPVLALVSCVESVEQQADGAGKELVFEASFGDASQTKTAVQEDGTSVWWSAHEDINIFYGASEGSKFTSTNDEPAAKATFTGTLNAFTGVNEGGEPNSFWAVYPYDATTTCDGKSVIVEIPTEQRGKQGSFADGQWFTVAKNYGLALSFYAVGAGFRFSVTKSNIKSVSFRGNNNEVLAGKARITMDSSNRPVVQEYLEPVSKVILLPQVGETYLTKGKLYYFSFFPNNFDNGFTVQFTTDKGEGARVYNAAVNFKRTDVHRGLDFDKNVTTFIRLQETDTITMGCSHQLKPVVSSSNNNATVTWKSSDPSVLEVDGNGVLYGKNAGTAVITATCDGATVSCTVPIGVPFKDANFKQYMLSNFDSNKDGVLSGEEALAVQRIECINKDIKSLQGIEYCPKLTYLDCGNNSNLGCLDVSCFPDLTELHCGGCGLSSLFFGNLDKLVRLYVDGNNLTEIDLHNMSKLKTLYAGSNKLKQLGPIPSEVLQGIMVQDNDLSGVLDLSKSPYITQIFINGASAQYDNNHLDTLYIHSGYKYNKTSDINQYYNTGPTRRFATSYYTNTITKVDLKITRWSGHATISLKETE